MVKLGFIVEGDTEKILVESSRFSEWLNAHDLELIRPVLDANGSGNLLPKHLEPMVKLLHAKDAQHIIILTDLENEFDVAVVKQRIANPHTDLIFVAVKAIEAWFLADSQAMCQWLKLDNFFESQPEATKALPWERLNEIAKGLNQRGTGKSKPMFAKRMIKHYGFDVLKAAGHTDCPSAKHFCEGLLGLSGVMNEKDS